MRQALAGAALLVAASWLAGCAAHSSVARLVDGKPITTRFVDAEAYDAFLRGALAESSGHDGEALEAYETAASADETAPDIWTRIGALECRRSPADDRGVEALHHAVRVDDQYGPAYRALAVCEESRGHHAESEAALARANTVDPGVASAAALARREGSAVASASLLALTEQHGDETAAWLALADWSRAHGDAAPLPARHVSRAGA